MKMDLFRAAAAAVTLAVVAIPSATTATSAPTGRQHNRVISIANRTSTAIYYVHISMPGEGWKEDWLASDEVISPDEVRAFDVSDRYAHRPQQCTFDVKVKYNNDVEHRLMGVNVCSVSRLNAQSTELVVAY